MQVTSESADKAAETKWKGLPKLIKDNSYCDMNYIIIS